MNSSKKLVSEERGEAKVTRLFVSRAAVLRGSARIFSPSIDYALQEVSVTMWQEVGQLEDEDGFLPKVSQLLHDRSGRRFRCQTCGSVS